MKAPTKPLQLKIDRRGPDVYLRTVAVGRTDGVLVGQDFDAFSQHQLVTLVDAGELARLQDREAYRKHVQECAACAYDGAGVPWPHPNCADGQRLAAVIGAT